MNWLDLLAFQGTLKTLHGQGYIPGMWGVSVQCGGGVLVMGWQDGRAFSRDKEGGGRRQTSAAFKVPS